MVPILGDFCYNFGTIKCFRKPI